MKFKESDEIENKEARRDEDDEFEDNQNIIEK